MNPLARFLESFSDMSILVVGDLMLDEYLWGHIERISPEAPVPVLNLIRPESMLGGAGNVLRNLSSLGATVMAAGVVGQDGTGRQILELLDVLGADSDAVITDRHRKSTRKARLMSLEHGQQVFRLDEESAQEIWGEVEDRLIAGIQAKAEDVHAILCSDYQKGLLTPRVLQAVFDAARRHHVPAIVGPKDSNAAKYRGAAILMPNAKELAQLVGARANGKDWLTDAAHRLVEMLDLQALVVTRGRDGMCLFEPGSAGLRRVDVPTVAQSVYDVTGAGDTAIAAFALALASGADCESAAQLANFAAGVVVGKRGTASITVEEIRDRLPETSMNAAS
ncbi:MAG TPA: D-glycero-beta-D-manno-heptose-7-phosphate kinase [Patescibacteria group bacterium]|nr:D-glycero-beta-D-manno-heptose-7-phosphate kinase [Patescibacteria group bacterium]